MNPNKRSFTDFISIDALEKRLLEIYTAIQKIPQTGTNYATWNYALDQVWTLQQRIVWMKRIENTNQREKATDQFTLAA